MARKIKDTKDRLTYRHNHAGLWIVKLPKVVGLLNEGSSLELKPAQARHIAKKLIQFADDIDRDK